MYSWSQLKSGVSYPNIAIRELNRLFHTRLYTRDGNPNGTDIMSEDWDNLIILDACRYDLFSQAIELDGELEHRISKGSGTVEFLWANFHNKTNLDTVYVTGNPQLYRFKDEINTQFHDVTHVWKAESWDDRYGTVLPEAMMKYAKDANENYPNKRVIIHLMQPHYPFITSDTSFDKGHLENPDSTAPFWRRIMQGKLEVSKDEIWKLYRENLNNVLPIVEEIISEFTGKTVVTSDHGNMIGERSSPLPVKEWGHPTGLYTEELVDIPWFVTPYEKRKQIVEEDQTNESIDIDEKTVSKRLKDLGYVG